MTRETIANWFEQDLKAITVGAGVTKSYRKVTRDPIDTGILTGLEPGDCVAGVYDMDEVIEKISTGETRKLVVVIEFYTRPKKGPYKSTQLNTILEELQIRYRRTQCGGNALLCNTVNNSIDIDGVFDNLIGGSLTFEIIYRVSYC